MHQAKQLEQAPFCQETVKNETFTDPDILGNSIPLQEAET